MKTSSVRHPLRLADSRSACVGQCQVGQPLADKTWWLHTATCPADVGRDLTYTTDLLHNAVSLPALDGQILVPCKAGQDDSQPLCHLAEQLLCVVRVQIIDQGLDEVREGCIWEEDRSLTVEQGCRGTQITLMGV